MSTVSSAVYEGVVRHRRHGPVAHAFSYRMVQLYLDLDELDTVFQGRWLWSTRRMAVARFCRDDYLGPAQLPLSEAVRECVRTHTGARPEGPIRLLTHPRYFGYVFNPVSFYYCFDRDEALEAIVAEITNTPWGERHAYVLPVSSATAANLGHWHWGFAKRFHVSPFMGMARNYAWRFNEPADQIRVHMAVHEDGRREFDATLHLQRRPLDKTGLARALVRYPLMTAQVMAGIHWQALRLWCKGAPVHSHPALVKPE